MNNQIRYNDDEYDLENHFFDVEDKEFNPRPLRSAAEFLLAFNCVLLASIWFTPPLACDWYEEIVFPITLFSFLIFSPIFLFLLVILRRFFLQFSVVRKLYFTNLILWLMYFFGLIYIHGVSV